MTREHKFLGGNRENLCVIEFRRDSTPPVCEKTRVDKRNKRGETTKNCRRHELRSPSGQLISRVVSQEK